LASCCVPSQLSCYPVLVVCNIGINSGVHGQGALLPPRYYSCEETFTHQRPATVTLRKYTTLFAGCVSDCKTQGRE
jgi:hypothetical protein